MRKDGVLGQVSPWPDAWVTLEHKSSQKVTLARGKGLSRLEPRVSLSLVGWWLPSRGAGGNAWGRQRAVLFRRGSCDPSAAHTHAAGDGQVTVAFAQS